MTTVPRVEALQYLKRPPTDRECTRWGPRSTELAATTNKL